MQIKTCRFASYLMEHIYFEAQLRISWSSFTGNSINLYSGSSAHSAAAEKLLIYKVELITEALEFMLNLDPFWVILGVRGYLRKHLETPWGTRMLSATISWDSQSLFWAYKGFQGDPFEPPNRSREILMCQKFGKTWCQPWTVLQGGPRHGPKTVQERVYAMKT